MLHVKFLQIIEMSLIKGVNWEKLMGGNGKANSVRQMCSSLMRADVHPIQTLFERVLDISDPFSIKNPHKVKQPS